MLVTPRALSPKPTGLRELHRARVRHAPECFLCRVGAASRR